MREGVHNKPNKTSASTSCQSASPCRHGVEKYTSLATLPRLRARVILVAVVVTVAVTTMVFECLQPTLLNYNLLCCSSSRDGKQVRRMLAQDGEDYDENSERIRYKHTKRRLPQCLIIGVRKGGTRALLEFLNMHPAIQAEKREMHFFDHDDNYNLGLEWYRKQMPFSFPGQITIEKTPAYFVEDSVPERVKKMNSSIKLILVVRNPTERAISDYMQIHSNRMLKNKHHDSFEDLVIDAETGEVRRSYNAIRRSIYHRHLERWLQWFPLKQFYFVSAENLVKDPVSELAKVEQFLGIENKLIKDFFYFNQTRGFYCIKREKRDKCLAQSKGRKHPDVNPIVITKLHEFFRPHNKKFYDLIGRDLGWP